MTFGAGMPRPYREPGHSVTIGVGSGLNRAVFGNTVVWSVAT